MSMAVRTWWITAVAAALAAGAAAETGFVDTFDRALGQWNACPGYRAVRTNGVMQLDVHKDTKWLGQSMSFEKPLDLSRAPWVNVKVKADTPCVLNVYLRDGKGADLRPRRVHAVGDAVDFCFDFSNAQKIDLSTVQGMIFTVNGAANSWDGRVWIDDLRLGDQARRLASLEGVADEIRYRDSGRHELRLRGLEHVAKLSLSGAERLIGQVKLSAIRDGAATLSYECRPGAFGSEAVTLSADAEPGFEKNALTFRVTVEDNLPPTLDAVPDQVLQAGVEHELKLAGISDGNAAAEQPLVFRVTAADGDVLPRDAMRLEHAAGSPYATLRVKPARPGETEVSVACDDAGPNQRLVERRFRLRAVKAWNRPPVIAPVPEQRLFNDAGRVAVALTGLGDGDGSRQALAITAVCTNAAVISGPIDVEYAGGDTATLFLRPNPAASGSAPVRVTVSDKGGAADNNGDQQAEVVFTVTTRPRPLDAFTETFKGWMGRSAQWRAEEGVEPVEASGGAGLTIGMRNKTTFGGLWLQTPDLDLAAAPYLSVDVRADQAMEFNVFLYDGSGRRNDGARQTTKIPAGEWKTVTFDFSGPGQMADRDGRLVDKGWVRQVLFNFHPKLGWPFSRVSGTLDLRNLRIGRAADVPPASPACTLGDLADVVLPLKAGRQTITLKGLSDGKGGQPSLAVTSSNPAVIAKPDAGRVNADGTAEVTFAGGETAGESTIEVTASAVGSRPVTRAFLAGVLDKARAAEVRIDAAKKAQTIRGFGTFYDGVPADAYGRDLGASAVRIGLIDNQVEPVNDNSDPDVLNRAALNYKAFDFAWFRQLKSAGVETFILTSWSPPAWMKANLSLNYQQGGAEGNCDNTDNRLDYDRYAEFAESMVAVVRLFQEEAGIELAGIGLQNEPFFHEPYPSAILDARRFAELITVVGARFEREGIRTPLFMPEEVFSQGASMKRYLDALNGDPKVERYCRIVAVHGYDEQGRGEARPDFPQWQALWKQAQQGSTPKELWMTETYPGFKDWNSALGYAVTLHGSMGSGRIGLWTSWGIDGQLLTQGAPNGAWYACSQFFRAIRPGAVCVDAVSADPDVMVTAGVNDAAHGGRTAVVLVNRGASARAVKVQVAGRPSAGPWSVTRSDRVNGRAAMGTLPPGEAVLLPARSVTTLESP